MTVLYQKQTETDGTESIVVLFPDGTPKTAVNTNRNYDKIVHKVEVEKTYDGLFDLFDLTKTVSDVFEKVSDRVSVRDGNVYFDGDPINNVLTDQIIRHLDSGSDGWKSLVNFWEKIATNPDAHSREHLLRWLKTEDFAITESGDIIGYKGVKTNLGSIHSGPAIVDGKPVTGHVPNQPGSVITMPRSNVQHNPAVGCSVGLHVGTHDYARRFGHTVLQVHVNPRDVVSVPTDCNDQKMRVCRYEVEGIYKDSKPYSGTVYAAEDYSSTAQVPA